MSVATQITRLQGVRDQIRTKMVGLGLSSNTDLLQDLADDLDGVSKISPTNNGTTDPGTGYTNVDTLSRSTSTRYIKVPKGYNDTNRKFTISGVANGAYSASVASHTTTNATAGSSVTGSITNVASTTKPSGTDGTNYYTITPKLTTGAGKSKVKAKATVSTAGYIATGSNETSEASKDVGVSGTQGGNYYLPAATYTDKSTTDPGTDYTNKLTVSPSGTASKYIQITKGYTPNSKITINKMSAGAYSASVSSHTVKTEPTASSSISGTITSIASKTEPSSGTYYTITPSLSTTTGSVEAAGKATVGTAGYIAAGSKTEGSTIDVGVSATQGSSYYLPASTFGSETTTDPTSSTNLKSVTPGTAAKYIPVNAGYRSAGKITVNAIPSPYYNTSGVTATDATVLKGYKFVDSAGTTVTGTIATASSSSISGSVSGDNPAKITLTTAKTSGSSSTTATASATVAKDLYTGSSNIEKDLTSKDFTATAEATLAASVSGSTTVPSTLPSGTVTITPNTDNIKRIYNDSTNKGFITNVVVNAMSSAGYTDKGITDPGTSYTNKLTISPSGTSSKYVQITKGYTPDSKITISKMSSGAIASATTTDPGTDYANKATVTPSTSTQYVKVSAGYLPNSKVTVNAIPSTKITLTTSGWSSTTASPELGSYTQTVTVTGVTASNKVIVIPDSGGDADVNGLLAAIYGVYAYSQAANSLTFRAFDKPTSSITYVVSYFS